MTIEYLTPGQARRWITAEVQQFISLLREGLTEAEAAAVLRVGADTADLYGDLLREVLAGAVDAVDPGPGGLDVIRARIGERPEVALHRARVALREAALYLGVWRRGPGHSSRLGHAGAGCEAAARLERAACGVVEARAALAAESAADETAEDGS
jgi:hypothetical protein